MYHITLDRPEKRNALTIELCRRLVEAFDHASNDASIGAVLLTGKGDMFCAGMDLRESLACDTVQLAGIHEKLFTMIHRVRKPVVAGIGGAALAAGVGLAANAHIVVAHPETRFALTEIRVGLWPMLIYRAVEHAVGQRRMLELSLTGRDFTAGEALTWGLVSEIAEQPEARAAEIATMIAGFSPMAIGAGLDLVHQTGSGAGWAHAGQIGRQIRDRLLASDDYKEGVLAFAEKRKPEWPSLKKS